MLVLVTGIYIHVVQQLGAQFVLGKHALYNLSQQLIRTVGLSHQAGGSHFALATGVTRV